MEEKKTNNNSLTKAKSAKKDEFYTQLPDIERELGHYKNHFKDKVVFCNCDDPKESNFFKYFALNFKFLGLKKLISTHYNKGQKSYKLEVVEDINNDGVINLNDAAKTDLIGDGDFRSDECIEILKKVDIVVTNPPFSLFREYVSQLVENKKKFIVIGSLNAITYKEIFQLIKENELWIGYGFKGGNAYFTTTHKTDEFAPGVYNKETNLVKFRNVTWYTNIEIAKRNEDIILYQTYDTTKYPKYDNCDAINVNKTKDIPLNYSGAMGVPISFLNNHNPNQFEILGLDDHELEYPNWRGRGPDINGKAIYRRVIIKNKRFQNGN
ncbi:MAG: modification methylase [Erysipelotrichia bacterium]|nr:modification methylase [Erysipelotrichia bacterium]